MQAELTEGCLRVRLFVTGEQKDIQADSESMSFDEPGVGTNLQQLQLKDFRSKGAHAKFGAAVAEARRYLGLKPLEVAPAEEEAEAAAAAEAATKKAAKARAKAEAKVKAAEAAAAAKAELKGKEEEEEEEGEEEDESEEEDEAEQLWAQCDACAKWRRLPESMRDSDELDEAWTCAMHPDPALRRCEVAEEGLGTDEVTTQVEVQEQGSCGTPGCKYSDFHLGPCSCWEASGGEQRKRRRSSSGEGMAAQAAEVVAAKAAKAEAKAKAAEEQAAEEQSAEEQSAGEPSTRRNTQEGRSAGEGEEDEEDEVTTQAEDEQGSCGTPGCKYADFHLGPCSCWETSGATRKRGRQKNP